MKTSWDPDTRRFDIEWQDEGPDATTNTFFRLFNFSVGIPHHRRVRPARDEIPISIPFLENNLPGYILPTPADRKLAFDKYHQQTQIRDILFDPKTVLSPPTTRTRQRRRIKPIISIPTNS
jgi:hypothetical protein